ncbi:MAG: mechanosensitive ion channel domain-containing protein [Verrucomicrobiota bacterium]
MPDVQNLSFIFILALACGLFLFLLLSVRVTRILSKRILQKVAARAETSDSQWITPAELQRIESFIVRLLKWIIIPVIAFLLITGILNFFPATQGAGVTLYNYIVAGVLTVINAIVGYIPNLLIIVISLLVTRMILSILKALCTSLKDERITIRGFYPEWADTTYNLLRILIIILLVIMIFPYLPGSHSDVFKGLSIFIGVIATLGSTSAISNIVGGIVLTYTRSFEDGDYIEVNDVKGQVVKRGLLATQLRSYKNEIVSIPNSSILTGHVTNYSTEAETDGLILHTEVTIGYDVPYEKVESLLMQAAAATEGIIADPAPFVLQTNLSDFYVHYELNGTTRQPESIPRIYSALHRNIQHLFNDAGIEILSPHHRVSHGKG